MQFPSIWFNKDKLLVWLRNAPLESIMEDNHKQTAVVRGVMMLDKVQTANHAATVTNTSPE